MGIKSFLSSTEVSKVFECDKEKSLAIINAVNNNLLENDKCYFDNKVSKKALCEFFNINEQEVDMSLDINLKDRNGGESENKSMQFTKEGKDFSKKLNLTLEETSEYSNIGLNSLRDYLDENEDLWFRVGTKRLVKRKKFEEAIDKVAYI